MKYLKLNENKIKSYKEFLNEAIKFKLNNDFDTIISDIENKKKAQVIESMLVKSIITIFADSIKLDYSGAQNGEGLLPKDFSTLNTQNKLNILFNSNDIARILYRKYYEKLVSVIDYINTNNISANNFEELYQKSVQWHEDISKGATSQRDNNKVVRKDEIEGTDKFITYPNGWYWINLNVDYSQDEADNMGHCGRDAGKILFSLRDNNSNSHITVSYKESEKAMYQCKGRGNRKPKSEYHKYILDMILNNTYPVNLLLTGSYRPDLDFNLMDLSEEERDELINKKPELEYIDNMFENYLNEKMWDKIVAMTENGFAYGGYKKCLDLDLLKYVIKQKLNTNDYINTNWYSPSFELNSTKEDVEFYSSHFDIEDIKKANIVYILWKNGIISDSEAETRISDLKIQEGKWFIKWKHGSWSDFSFMFSSDGMDGHNSYSYEEYVAKNIDEFEHGYLNYSIGDCDLDDLTIKTKTAILEKIEEDGIILEESEIEELLESDEDYGFETIEDYSFDKVKTAILADKGGDSLKELLRLDSLDDIKDKVVNGYEDAQEDADESEMFAAVMGPVKDFFKIEKFVWEGENLLLEFDPKYAFLLNRCEEDKYYPKELTRIIEKIFDNSTREYAYEEYGMEESDFPEYLEFNHPYYGWNGSVDEVYLNEIVRERLGW
jgi:hypothetical protein